MNHPPNIEIKKLVKEDLIQVAQVHSKAFHDSALTKLGKEPVRRYYEWQLNGPHICHAVGAFNPQGSLVGFCFAGEFHGSLSGFLSHNKRFLTWWIITHPWQITNSLIMDRVKRAINILSHKSKTQANPGPARKRTYGILSIAVDPAEQGKGFGRIIMDDVKKDALGKGFDEIGLTVHPTNVNAVSFYEGCGWRKIINDQDQEWSGSMALSIH